MHCRDFRRSYSAYRDAADAALTVEMDEHLASCPNCTAYDRALREGVDALRGARLTPSADFLERLNARIASGEAVPEPVPPRVSPWGATAAAVLLIALIMFTIRQSADVPTVAAAERPAVLARPQMVPGIPFVAFVRVP
jgi:hypothetical protein